MATFRVLLRMRIRPGAAAAFERDWRDGAARVSAQRASVAQWLARSADEAEVYYVVSDWTDEASFRDYERSDVHQQHLRRLRPHRVDGSMSTMAVLAAVPGRSS
jgi:heme-degrading monooxygenase HmoA